MEYIEIIYNILKPGGLWINIGKRDTYASAKYNNFIFNCSSFVGPLLYHYENMPGEMSIELSLEEVKSLVRKIGFDIKVIKS